MDFSHCVNLVANLNEVLVWKLEVYVKFHGVVYRNGMICDMLMHQEKKEGYLKNRSTE